MAFWNRTVSRAVNGPTFTVSDVALAEFLGVSGVNDAGVNVGEYSALGLTAFWRSVNIIAGTLAGLPQPTYEGDPDGDPDEWTKVPGFMDAPGGPWFSPFEWRETVYAHLAIHGNAFLLRVYNAGGGLAALFPVHPSLVSVRWWGGERLYSVTIPRESPLGGGEIHQYTEAEIVHVRGLCSDGLRGFSPISVAANPLGTGLAGDQAAARMFANGLLLGGVVSAPDVNEAQAKEIKRNLKAKLGGSNNAGDIAVIDTSLTFHPWTMNAHDAQFIEARQMQVEEVARLMGIPKVLLAEDGASTWGSGIAQLDQGMAKYTFMPYTERVESRIAQAGDILPPGQFIATNYTRLFKGTPLEEAQLALLKKELAAPVVATMPAPDVNAKKPTDQNS